MKFTTVLSILLISVVLSGTNLYVKYSGKANNFNTIQQAVNKAASLKPSGEGSRVTIHIAPGKYREQIIVNTPYITFVNDEPSKGTVTITWYYGIGYKYYSANSNGYYDANLAKKKSSRNIASKWGATVQIWNQAKYFKANNIIFENSFNRYMTAEEIADGITLAGDSRASSITFKRTSSSDVKSRAATERAAAMTIEAPYAEFYACRFYSSQDTLYTGASPAFFRKCVIEGETDYIFGEANAVFDFCELRWKGYTGTPYPGYITAARQGSTGSYTGYLFNKCRVYGSSSNLPVTAGYFGRPWAATAKVMFINTTLQDKNMILPAGWYSMSGVNPENCAGLKEYGTKYKDGSSVSLSSRKGHVLSANSAASINKINYMNNWNPTYLNA
jgi:pectin methylesterase-like acyl-CoA thioesterase